MAKFNQKSVLWMQCLLTVLFVKNIKGHGYLVDPPARNAMWRFGYPNPVNYNDNQLFCGGYAVQWEQNNGKCGVCGDPYHFSNPRPHEAGGLYAKGIIGRRYFAGQEIYIEIELTVNHGGRFEFSLCPNNNPKSEATQECFDRHPLILSGTRNNRLYIPHDSPTKGLFRYKARLPPFLTCSQCVLQWTYYTGNMWGICPNGTEAVGCGKPETYKNCADISIVTSTGGLPPSAFRNYDDLFLLYHRDYKPYHWPLAPVPRDQLCVARDAFRIVPGMDNWCQINCLSYLPNCPEDVCFCPANSQKKFWYF